MSRVKPGKKTVQEAIIAARLPQRLTRSTANIITKPPSIRQLAARFDVTKAAVVKALKSSSSPSEVPKKRGRPLILTPDEEAGIVGYVIWLEKTGFPAEKSQVEAAAQEIIRRRDPSAPPVSKNWYPRFRARHPELQKSFVKAVDKARKSFESADVDNITTFFDRLQKVIIEYRLSPSEIWNEDECGMRIGCLRERIEVLITHTTRSQRPEVPDPANRETSTLVGAENAVGDSIPPWLIFKAFPTESWATIDCIPGMRFARSDSAFSNREISCEWLRTFNLSSWSFSSQAQRTGSSLADWFGCDEWLRDPQETSVIYEKPPTQRPEDEKIYRMLVIDGFTGHMSYAFVNYCIQFDIILCTLPPHSTHILQPLDVGVFQPLKNAHQKALRQSIREGNLSFSRAAFAEVFKAIYTLGFTAHNLMAGFEKSGIYPPSSTPAIKKILEKKRQSRQGIDPSLEELLPKEFRFQYAADQLETIIDRYRGIMDSPSRAALRSVRRVIYEAVLMDSQRKGFLKDYHQRLASITSRRKPGKQIRPTGRFVTSVNADDIRQQHEEQLALEEVKQQRSQLRSGRSLLIQEVNKLQVQWREEKKVRIEKGQGRLTWKQWLSETGKDLEFISLETSKKRYNELLNQKADGFMIDTKPDPSFAAEARAACRTARPILAMRIPNSDDTVTFTNFGPFHDEDDDPHEEEEDNEGIATQREETPRWMRSSPPLGSEDALEETVFETPCPSQPPPAALAPPPRRQLWKQIEKELKEFRVKRTRKEQSGDHDTMRNTQ